MPTLPDADRLTRATPTATRRQVAPADTGQIGRALTQFGRTTGAAVSQVSEGIDRRELAAAQSSFLKGRIQLESDIESSTEDFSTFEGTYNSGIGTARSEAASGISNARVRDAFLQSSDVDVTRGLARVNGLALRREADVGVASLSTLLDGNRSAALTAGPEDRERLIDSSNLAIQGARDSGFLTEVQSTELRREWADSFARGSLDMMSPAQRIQALDGGAFSGILQPDEIAAQIAKDRKSLETETVKFASQAASDTIMDLGLTEIEALGQAADIPNPKVREETEQRIRRSYQDIQRGTLANERALDDSAWAIIEQGGTPDDFTSEMRVELGPKLGTFWTASSRDRAQGGPGNDVVYWGLRNQLGNDRAGFADVNLSDPEIKGQLTQKRWDELKEEQTNIQTGETVGSARVQTNNQIVNSAIAEMDITTGQKAGVDDIAKANAFRNWISGQFEVFEQTNGRKPTETEVREIVNRATIAVASDQGLFSFEEKIRGFELGDMTPAQAAAIKIPDADRELILQAYFDQNGADAAPLSEDQIREAYLWKVTGGG